MSAFDPVQRRAAYAQFSSLAQARQLANEPLNLFFWDNALAEVACSYMIGIGAEATPQELLSLTRRVLSEALASGALDEEPDADEDGLYQAASSLRTLALAEWIATGEHQRKLFDRAYALRSRYFDRSRKKKKPSLEYGIFPVVTVAVAAERFDDAKRFLEATVPDKKFDPAKSRTVAEFALALATLPAPHIEAAERFLRSNLAERLEHGGYLDGAMQLYLASVAKLPGSSREVLARATQYISYLAAAAAKTKSATAKTRPAKTKSKRPEPPPAPSHPRLARIIPSSAGFEDVIARVATGRGNRDAIWQETPAGWAVHMRGFAYDDREFIARRNRIVEIFDSRTVLEAHKYPSLRRASSSAETLSECARANQPLALEVAFSPAVDNWFDGRRVPTPPKLSRRIWKDALAVGALVNLRAISIDARESPKDKLARGDDPYAITPDWFWTTALSAQLEALEVIADPHDLGTSLTLFENNPRLRELIVWFQTERLYTACFWCSNAPPMACVSSFRARTHPSHRNGSRCSRPFFHARPQIDCARSTST